MIRHAFEMLFQPSPAHRAPRVLRRYDVALAPRPFAAEIHAQDCACLHCRPDHVDRLTATDIGKLAIAGILVGNAIAFTVDPHGAWAALSSALWSIVS